MNPTANDRPTVPAATSDLELLRACEPVVRYTRGELFFPMDVERYLTQCSLWVHHPGGGEEQLVPQGQLTVEQLTQLRQAQFGEVQFLRFVQPMALDDSARALNGVARLRRNPLNRFRAGQGRLARGGLLPRLADGMFTVSLLLRGRVPGATAAAAALAYHDLRDREAKYVYYGRVVRQGGWTILQYWFFFAYNSWRSGYGGINDHESDWEMITVYLYERDGQLVPEWAAYASHDFHGADLRRRWDDGQELDLEQGHPVVYAGAGSHASYFRRGEYQAEAGLPLPTWLTRAAQTLRNLWFNTLGQAGRGTGRPFRIPFVDYARGDGLSVGPGQAQAWTPVVIDERTGWVSQYRGLWGLFARDPISGENAPAGPMYNRDGSPRGSWYDPLGFAELDRVPPPPLERSILEQRAQEIDQRQAELAQEVPGRLSELQELGIQLKSMEGSPHLARQYRALAKRIAETSDHVRSLRREQAENAAVLEGLTWRLDRLRAGQRDDPHAHIRHMARPVVPARIRFNRAVEFWAAISLSLLLLGLGVLILLAPQYLWIGASVLVLAFILVEAMLRGTFTTTINTIAVVLAGVAAVILVIQFLTWIIVGGLMAAALFLLLQKVRELRG